MYTKKGNNQKVTYWSVVAADSEKYYHMRFYRHSQVQRIYRGLTYKVTNCSYSQNIYHVAPNAAITTVAKIINVCPEESAPALWKPPTPGEKRTLQECVNTPGVTSTITAKVMQVCRLQILN